ncbi:probable choline kinase 1 [Amaranthus tricolor]|uniref:probable choline kinase 1 n=1 Tax=Amaranthus tricolor TaxID=29722 RepID=UPI00258D4006|nr:probable choline kinase 1 [Amaranthus tricolor]
MSLQISIQHFHFFSQFLIIGTILNTNQSTYREFFLEKNKMAIKTNGFLEGSLPEELMQLLVTLASRWEDVNDPNEIQVKRLSGAMTNEVFQIKWANEKDDLHRKVLVRIYGEGVDVFFNRDDEIKTFECLSHHGQGPRLLGRFSDGRVEEFLHARTLSAEDLRDPEISGLIAGKMREFHKLEMPGTKTVVLWTRLRRWLRKAKSLCSLADIKEFGLDHLDDEIQLLEKELTQHDQELGFCHNDLQYGNIMMDEETKFVTLIDYEYASYNPIAYDIANHFSEMAANYHTDQPHILDYTKYPDEEERRRFIQAYLSSSGDDLSDSEVENLLKDVDKYSLANHLFWGLWGIISAYVNNIDFDYKEYARQRLEQYWLKKSQVLSPYAVCRDDGENGF